MRGRLTASAIRNRAVTGNIARRILIATPTGCAHLMPQEAGHSDEECHAHQKWRRKHGQILHRAHPLRLMRSLVVSVLLALRLGPWPSSWWLALARRDGPARRALGQAAARGRRCCLLLGILADRRPAALAGPVPGGPARPGAVVGRPRDWTEIAAALP